MTATLSDPNFMPSLKSSWLTNMADTIAPELGTRLPTRLSPERIKLPSLRSGGTPPNEPTRYATFDWRTEVVFDVPVDLTPELRAKVEKHLAEMVERITRDAIYGPHAYWRDGVFFDRGSRIADGSFDSLTVALLQPKSVRRVRPGLL